MLWQEMVLGENWLHASKAEIFGIMIFPPIVALKYIYLDLFDHFPAIQVPVLIKPSSI